MSFTDGGSLDEAVSRDETLVRVGQIWKDRPRKPDSAFVVLKVYERRYRADHSRYRVTGVLTTEHSLQTDRDMDIDSLRSMFPHLMFEPNKPERIEDK